MLAKVMVRLLQSVAPLLFVSGASIAHAALPVIAEELLYNHRRLVVLSEAAPHLRAEARRAGHYLFVRNQHLLRELVREMQTAPGGTAAERYREFARAADREVGAEGDRLALRAPLRALIQAGVLQGDALAEGVHRSILRGQPRLDRLEELPSLLSFLLNAVPVGHNHV